jgi:ureidoglycolate lyase
MDSQSAIRVADNFSGIDLLRPPSTASVAVFDVPTVRASAESLRGFGRVIPHFAGSGCDITPWPVAGRRPLVPGTGIEGGVVEDVFTLSRRGAVQFAANVGLGRQYCTGWYGKDPATASEKEAVPPLTAILTHEANYHPCGGQVFASQDGVTPFVLLLAPPGDDVTPASFTAFYCDPAKMGGVGVHIFAGVWHQPPFPAAEGNTVTVMDNRQGRVHACVAVDFLAEFGGYLRVPLLPPAAGPPAEEEVALPPGAPVWNRAVWAACAVRPRTHPSLDGRALADPAHLTASYALLVSPPPSPAPVTVFVPTELLRAFLTGVWPTLHAAASIILVTGLADCGPAQALGAVTAPRWGDKVDPPPDPSTSCAPLAALLADSRLRSWHAENLDFAHPKAAGLPLGIDLHTLAWRGRPEWGPLSSPSHQAEAVWAARAAALAAPTRDDRVYVHFGLINRRRLSVLAAVGDSPAFALHPSLVPRLMAARAGTAWTGGNGHIMPRVQLWAEMSRHRWVASVEGYGVDCHRVWEALALGCGVVVQDCTQMRATLYGFPVLFVPGTPAAWAAVTVEALAEAWRTWAGGDETGAHGRAGVRLRAETWVARVGVVGPGTHNRP